ncbi:MAG: hypothetical protein ACO215_09325, partial [Vulcanococcus sp.]
ETYSDLLIQSGGSDVEEGSISDVAEERNREQEATCDQCGGGWCIRATTQPFRASACYDSASD